MQINPSDFIKFTELEDIWHENEKSKIKNINGNEINNKILIKLIKSVNSCSDLQLMAFMKHVGVQPDGDLFKRASFFEIILGPEESEIAKVFKEYRKCDVKTFFDNKELNLNFKNQELNSLSQKTHINVDSLESPGQLKQESKEKLLSIKDNFSTFLNDLKSNISKGHFNQLIINTQAYLAEDSKAYSSVRMMANIFGEEFFKGKKYNNEKMEGFSAAKAVWHFLEGLGNYYNSIQDSLSQEEREKFKEIVEAYYIFQLSAMIELNINIYPAEYKDGWRNLGKELLMKDISDVQSGKKKRGYCYSGFKGHFVPLRYEKLENGRFVIGTFNLGGGIEEKKTTMGRITSETRINPTALDSKEKLEKFCEEIIKLKSLEESDWVKFLASVKQGEGTDRLRASYRPRQKIQKIGNCACKGQWALLNKEFDRLFADHPSINFKNFKSFLQKEDLLRLQPTQSVVIPLGEDYNDTGVADSDRMKTDLTKEQIYQICWRNYHKVNRKQEKSMEQLTALLPKEEKWKTTCLQFSTGNLHKKPMLFSLGSLFGDNDKVVMGKKPDFNSTTGDYSLEPNANYYRIPNLFERNGKNYANLSDIGLILTKNNQGEITITVNQQATPTIVTTNDGKKVVYREGNKFVLTPNIRFIELGGFKIDFRFF